ncbi:PilW family protein [Xylophilus sp. GOD-11R]|uniref:PilW family protein n=1 Tax=Xylophilus sp. GOD-11R TaxID=3089814 RepID=UPI00298C19EB|nr:PilW family protein [Xylophilus sp. GOD-11R]WPB57649.1 PilW family protein [Xylophilus sp. GOD-11R]
MSRSHPSPRTQRGFSLLELMIAVVIGMFSVVVILQVLSGTATSRRIAVGGGDAQLNGVAAIRALQLDLEQAGLGLQSFNISGCSLAYTAGDGASVTLAALAPVVINAAQVPAGDTNTDTLIVIAGNSGSPSEGDVLTAATNTIAYVVTTPDSFATGNRVVAAPATRGATCALSLARVTGLSGFTLAITGGVSGLASGSIAYNLGSTPTIRAYAVRNGDLTVCDYLTYDCGRASYASPVSEAVWVPVAGNIASMRAQYARDTSGIAGATSTMDGVVDTFDQLTPGVASDSATIPVYCKWARIVGVQIAVVARSQQYDQTLAYTGYPTLTTTKTVLQPPTWAGSASAPITLTGTNWDRYRYTVMQTRIPLRNAIWQGAQPTYQGGSGGC